MKAAIYARFSTDRQNESSISDQVRICREHCAREGWSVTEKFEDLGISGAALGNRPGILRLQEGALARRFDVVVAVDLSRLSRSTADLNKMIDRFVPKGIRVIGINDGYDSSRKGHKLQAGLSGIIGEAFREMISDRTYAALESRAKDRKPTGGRAYGYRAGKIAKREAQIVREIFKRFSEGESCRTIAAELNRRAIPSPGSSWSRSVRRASGWMSSAIRAMLQNERYRGAIHWNTSVWLKDPDSGKRSRQMRPRSEWISHHDDSLRIVTDDAFKRVQRRMAGPVDERQRSGGKPKFLLSGLLRCAKCEAHYVIVNARDYGCSSHTNGNVCDNKVRVKRTHVESVLLADLRNDVLSPDSVKTIARDMQELFRERTRASKRQTAERPRELQELDARLDRLRDRLKRGDPDMAADEIQAAIGLVDEKRRAMLAAQPDEKATAKVLEMLPKAAESARREIESALAGNSRAALKARVILRELYSGRIDLTPEADGGLIAHWNLNSSVLLRAVGTVGSGGRI